MGKATIEKQGKGIIHCVHKKTASLSMFKNLQNYIVVINKATY